jgi:hypothetical protein
LDIGELKNSLSINEDTGDALIITSYNTVIVPSIEYITGDNLRVYCFDNLTTARDNFIYNNIVVNDGDAYSVYFFSPLHGVVINLFGNEGRMGLSRGEDGLKLYIDATFDETGEDEAYFLLFEQMYPANSEETKVYYWMFKESIEKVNAQKEKEQLD